MNGYVFQAEINNRSYPAVGSTRTLRLTRSESLAVAPAHGAFMDAVYSGRCYSAHNSAAGVAPGTAIDTSAPISIFNPSASNTLLVIHRGRLGYVSGTLGAGFISWCIDTTKTAAAPSGGTALTPRNLRVGNGDNSQASVREGSTLANTPTPLRVFGSLDALLASSVVGPWSLDDRVDGEIVIEPGCTLSLQATAAGGSTPLVVWSVSWEEIPLF